MVKSDQKSITPNAPPSPPHSFTPFTSFHMIIMSKYTHIQYEFLSPLTKGWIREDIHKKVFILVVEALKPWYPPLAPPLELSCSKPVFYMFFLSFENGLKWIENADFFPSKFENLNVNFNNISESTSRVK